MGLLKLDGKFYKAATTRRGVAAMNDLWPIRCVMMRGGTSRGPFFQASDLPADPDLRDRVLLSVMGAGHPLQVDGIGGGHALTSKIAIVGPSIRADAEVDYLFAQVSVLEQKVDTSPNCGNMLAGVAPFAIETGLVAARDGVTSMRIFNVNTGKIIEASVETPAGRIRYRGDTQISGVPGSAAPITLTFPDAAGSKTGALLPTGKPIDTIDDVQVSCVDAAMPVVMARASDYGKTGHESAAELSADAEFLAALEATRIAAGSLMGIPDAADLVIPKPVLLARGKDGADLTARYFMPHSCHPSLAATGSIAIALGCCIPGTLAAQLLSAPVVLPATLVLAHPSGNISVAVEQRPDLENPTASVVRTARLLFSGTVYACMPAPAAA